MMQTRTSRTMRGLPWAAAALLLSLSGCGGGESHASPSAVTPPDKSAPHSDRTTMPPAKLENPPPAPAPAPTPTPEPKPLEETKPVLPPPADPPPPPVIDPPAPTPAPEPKPEPKPEPPPKPDDVSVTGFETGGSVGPDGHVGDAKTVFAPTDTVNLAVLADGAARAVRIGVTWIGPDGAKLHEESQDLTLGTPKAVPFALTDAKGLALGHYKAEIRIENWLAQTAEFDVR